MIGNETIENVGSDVQGKIDEWKYEGGLYNPGEALYFAGVSFMMKNDNEYALFSGDRKGLKFRHEDFREEF